MSDIIDPTYLPFTVDELRQHFVGESREATDRRVQRFVESARRYRDFISGQKDRRGVSMSAARGPCQIEKDETFWTAATMMALSRAPVETIARWLARAFGHRPPLGAFASWLDALGSHVELVLEAPLPSSKAYLGSASTLAQARNVIPYVKDAALKRASDNTRTDLEGTTKVDALLVAPSTGVSILVEAKVLSDLSCQVTFDPLRNQLARLVDVMLEPSTANQPTLSARAPERSVALLLTPRLFKDNPHSRLYGRLFGEYRDQPDALARDLPHRQDQNWSAVSSRIAWTTWEDTREVLPNACPWLGTPNVA